MENSLDSFLDSIQSVQVAQLKQIQDRISKARSALTRSLVTGEISKITTATEDLIGLSRAEIDVYSQMHAMLQSFDVTSHFAQQFQVSLFAECQNAGVGITGVFPIYAVASFPVVIDLDRRKIDVNGRELEIGRTRYLAEQIKAEVDSLEKNGYPPDVFVSKLAAAYDVEVTASTGRNTDEVNGLEVPLTAIYGYFIPGKTERLKYPLRQFSHDIFRMLSAGQTTVEGRRVIFSMARDRSHSVRVVLPSGQEVYYGSVSFSRAEVQ